MILSPSPLESKADPRFLLDRLRLRFIASSVEQQFEQESMAESLGIIRLYLGAAVGLYAAFSVLDVISEDPALLTLLTIRIVVCIVLATSCALTFHPSFLRESQRILLLAMISPGLGVVAMTTVMRAPFNNLYYAGLIMVVIYGSTLVRLRYSYAVVSALVMVTAYQFSALLINPIGMKFYICNNFFLIMASAVGLFSGYLQEHYIRMNWVDQKIIEAKNEQTEILLVEAQKASRSKSDFLANMSHELRTPLNAILGFSDIISRELLGPIDIQKYVEYSADINNSGAHLLAIINEILDLARAESGKLHLEERDVDLLDCVVEAIRICQPVADKGGVILALTPDSAGPLVRGDRRLLMQIILNLISNAVKFTPAQGRIDVSLQVGPEDVRATVRDTGIGIPTDNIERVMRPFEQVATSYSRSHGGTGLGLPYSAKLAELHDGAIRLESDLHNGTTATLILPLSRLVGTAAQPELRAAS